MALFPGWQAPDFMIATPTGPISFHAWHRGRWRIVLTHPGDYTAHSLRLALPQIRGSGTGLHLLGLSPFPLPEPETGIVPYPGMPSLSGPGAAVTIIQDDTGHVRTLWRGTAVDAGPEDAMTDAHAVFIVDPVNTIRSTIIYPVAATGRDFDEILRVLSALDTGHPTLDQARRAA